MHLVATVGANPLPIVGHCLARADEIRSVRLIATLDSNWYASSVHRAHGARLVIRKRLPEVPVEITELPSTHTFADITEPLGQMAEEMLDATVHVLYSGGTQLMSAALAMAFAGVDGAQLLEAPFGGGPALINALGVEQPMDLKESLSVPEVGRCHEVKETAFGEPQNQDEADALAALAGGVERWSHRPKPNILGNVTCYLPRNDDDPGEISYRHRRKFDLDLCAVIGIQAFVGEVKSKQEVANLQAVDVAEARARTRHFGGMHARCFVVINADTALDGETHKRFPDVPIFSLVDLETFAEDPAGSSFGKWMTGKAP